MPSLDFCVFQTILLRRRNVFRRAGRRLAKPLGTKDVRGRLKDITPGTKDVRGRLEDSTPGTKDVRGRLKDFTPGTKDVRGRLKDFTPPTKDVGACQKISHPRQKTATNRINPLSLDQIGTRPANHLPNRTFGGLTLEPLRTTPYRDRVHALQRSTGVLPT